MLKSKIGFKIVLIFFALVVIVFFREKFLLKEVKAGPTFAIGPVVKCKCLHNDVYCKIYWPTWTPWWKDQECGNNSWTNNYRCSGSWSQRLYLRKGCSYGSCYTRYDWKNYQYCGSSSWSNYYRCSGNWLQRRYLRKGCSYGSCYTRYDWKNYQYCGSDYWTNSYRCSGTMRQRLYVHRDCSGSSCYSRSEWKNYQNCGSDYWTNSYRCSGTMRQRLYVHRGCSGSSCYSWSEWKNYQNCGSGRWTNDYHCSGNWLQRRYVAEGCRNNRCYDISQWKNYRYCGTDQWRNDYRCSGSWRQRRYADYGCFYSKCRSYSKWANWQNCGTSSWTNNYRCSGNWVQRQYHYKGCSGSSCYDYYGWKNWELCEYDCFNGACVLAPGNYPPYIESGTLRLDGDPDYCNCPVGTGRIGFKWTYKDKEGDDQSYYWLQIATDSGFNNRVVDYTTGQTISSGSTGTSGVTVKLSPSSGKLEIGFNDTYYWRMKVKDKKGNWSSWENGSPATLDTPFNPYPRPNFTWELKDHEEEMPMEKDVLFTNQTVSYALPNSYSWTFQDGNPPTSNEENPTVKFTLTDPPEKEVTLSVVDSNGYFCPLCVQSVTVTEGELPLPEWKEIPPF